MAGGRVVGLGAGRWWPGLAGGRLVELLVCTAASGGVGVEVRMRSISASCLRSTKVTFVFRDSAAEIVVCAMP